jgi:hypothetical protein
MGSPLVLVIFGVLFGLVVVVNIVLGHNKFSDSALGDATSTWKVKAKTHKGQC